jgi:gas vesicle protein
MSRVEEKEKIILPVEKAKAGAFDGVIQPQVRGEEGVGVGNIEKVRDILFGTQMRDYEKRFVRMEERMNKEVSNLRDEVKKSFDSIESYTKGELESLSDRLKAEQNERGESIKREGELLGDRLKTEQNERTGSIKDLSREVNEAQKALEKRLGQLDDQLNKFSSELRQQILDQSKELSDMIRLKYEDAIAALEKLAHELRSDKVDRSKLSELLMGMALHLTDEATFRSNIEADDSLHE